LVDQLPVGGPAGHGVEYHIVACGGDEHDDFEEVAARSGPITSHRSGFSPASSATSSDVGR
jgi:hypothetical protein